MKNSELEGTRPELIWASVFLGLTVTMDTQPPEFNGGNWVNMARFAAAAGTVLSTVTAAILLMVDPPRQCPNWYLNDGHSSSLWGMWATLVLLFLIPACFIAFCWNWIARKAATYQRRKLLIESLFGPMTPPAIPVTYIMVILCVAGALLSQLPLLALVTQCTGLAVAIGCGRWS